MSVIFQFWHSTMGAQHIQKTLWDAPKNNSWWICRFSSFFSQAVVLRACFACYKYRVREWVAHTSPLFLFLLTVLLYWYTFVIIQFVIQKQGYYHFILWIMKLLLYLINLNILMIRTIDTLNKIPLFHVFIYYHDFISVTNEIAWIDYKLRHKM